MIKVICAQCLVETTPSPKHTYCPACLKVREKEKRKMYKEHHQGRAVSKTLVMALEEQKVIRESIRTPRTRKEQHLIETDAEQLQIRKACAARTLNVDITHPSARHLVRPCAWLFS